MPHPQQQNIILPDIIPETVPLRLLLCGYNPGDTSAKQGHYYAHAGNWFWRVLHRVGLTPTRLLPEEDKRITEYGIGLTDLLKTSKHSDGAVPRVEDIARLRTLVLRHQPQLKILAFAGKAKPAECFFGYQVGWGDTGAHIGGTAIWVVPSTSPRNANKYQDATHAYWRYWHDLANEFHKGIS